MAISQIKKNYKTLIVIVLIYFILIPLIFNSVIFAQGLERLTNAANAAGYKPVDETSVAEILGAVVRIALSFLGVIFLILIVYGGYLWMTAGGNEEQIGKAKKIITSGIIGMVIVLCAWVIYSFIAGQLIGVPQEAPPVDTP